MFDRHEILKRHYVEQIARDWKLDSIKSECQSNQEPSEDGDSMIGRCYIGSCFSIMPSGKYYMPWTSNQTRADETRDSAFLEALEEALETIGAWLESGEVDPCDMFAAMSFDMPESDDAEGE